MINNRAIYVTHLIDNTIRPSSLTYVLLRSSNSTARCSNHSQQSRKNSFPPTPYKIVLKTGIQLTAVSKLTPRFVYYNRNIHYDQLL